jgi:hypothetical protein
MFKFITNKPFWVNLLAAMALGFLIIFMILQLLGWLTKHGEYLTVPSVMGKSTADAIKLLDDKGFEVVITDSVYTDTASRGSVLKQIPDANSTVKINRTVFITVNRYVPPMVVVPPLEGKSLSFVLALLQRNHLQLGDTTFRNDFAKGTVLELSYRGRKISAGAKVQWGSRIDMVISNGIDESTNTVVPDFVGMTYAQAKAQLDSLGVLVALAPTPDVKDTMSAFIYKQRPAHLNENKQLQYIKAGMFMDIFLSREMIFLSDSTDTKKKN